MSPIATAGSAVALKASAPPQSAAASSVASLPVAPAPMQGRATARDLPGDAARDMRFAETVNSPHAVRQIAQQIAASFAYGAHVSVVTTGTGVHATIDVSA